MAKSVTYNDLEGTAPVVSVGGIEFEDGKAVEVEDEEIAAKLDGNAYFMVEGSTKKKVGRPRKEPGLLGKEPERKEPDPILGKEPTRTLSGPVVTE